MNEENYTRQVPINELDLQMQTVNSEWGRDITPELRERLKEAGELKTDNDGKLIVTQKELWGVLAYYTRDMRLGFLDKETYYMCVEWLDFAGDMIRLGMVKPFLTALSRVITMLELSQSKSGFLRKQLNTITQQHYNEYKDNEKKGGLFSKKSKDNGGF